MVVFYELLHERSVMLQIERQWSVAPSTYQSRHSEHLHRFGDGAHRMVVVIVDKALHECWIHLVAEQGTESV